nr:hypothetical protein [Tanacetum cinerariifolium]
EITCSCFHGFIDKDLINLVIPDVRRKNTKDLNTKISKLNEKLSDSVNTMYHYKLGLSQVKKEKEGLDSKLIGFESASKDLDTLLGSQRSDKNKEGLGYSAVPPPSCSSILSS